MSKKSKPYPPPRKKAVAAANEARKEVKAEVEKVLAKMPRRNVPKQRKIVVPKESGPKVDETGPLAMSSGVKPGYTVMVPKAEAPRPVVKPVPNLPPTPDPTPHRLQHPKYDRYYLFHPRQGYVLVEKWDGGKRVENRQRTVPDARGLYDFLRKKAGYIKPKETS